MAGSYDGAAAESASGARLVDARHPLLGANAVPISLALETPASALVITGPNTGGKTAALKTLGLLALMNQTGLRLPCGEGTALPVFDAVYADVGDQQSIERAVSTFSSHLTAIADVLAHASPRSLVLLDELGAATDPDEGAALGCAVAAHLAERGVPSVVTTHHRALAALAEEHPAMTNASVELDAHTLRPTYKLTMGLPGRSYATEIAARAGLDACVVAAARERLGPVHRETEGLLSAIRRERAAAREKLDEAEAERREAARRSADLAAQIEALEAERADIAERTRAELLEDAKRARETSPSGGRRRMARPRRRAASRPRHSRIFGIARGRPTRTALAVVGKASARARRARTDPSGRRRGRGRPAGLHRNSACRPGRLRPRRNACRSRPRAP